jgi:hypothetical protein
MNPAGVSAFPDSGYFALKQPQGTLIADFGGPGNSYNPGHLHAGIFSFELSIGPRRVIIDRGTPTYDPGPERNELRATASHNTLEVNEANQFDVWKAFRVGRRASIHELEYGETRGLAYLTAWHDGYRPLGIIHRRTILSIPGAGWIIHDLILGAKPAQIRSRLHLDPGINPTHSGGEIVLPDLCRITTVDMPPPEITVTTYARTLGERLPTHAIVWRAQPSLPAQWLLHIAPRSGDEPASDIATGRQEILRCSHGVLRLRAHPGQGILAEFEL